jgi:hypothetical protein
MVMDFRQTGPRSTQGVEGAEPAAVLGRSGAQQRKTVLIGIGLSAALVALAGVWLLVGEQDFIPAGEATYVAILCFSVAVADLVVIKALKQLWRRRDGR